MAKNPFIVSFETPISEPDKQFLQDISDECYDIFPHTYLLFVYSSLSSFRYQIHEHFRNVPHFTCQIQKGEKFVLRPFVPGELPRP